MKIAYISKSWATSVLVAVTATIACMSPALAASNGSLNTLRLDSRVSGDLKISGELFLKPNLSVGEASLVTSDPVQTWRAAQARLWLDMPNTESSNRLFFQSGLGFMERDPLLQHSLLTRPSVVIPLGVGIQYALRSNHRLTTMFSLDISEGRFGPGAAPHIAPGLSFGLRF